MGAVDGARAFAVVDRSFELDRRPSRPDDDDDSVTLLNEGGLQLRLVHGVPAHPTEGPARQAQLFLKRWALDVPVALLALIALSPVFALIGLAVVCADGLPIIFAQERVGLRGKSFRLFKFRTTRQDASDPSGLMQIMPNDDRLTRLGRFLRRSSLDELPQLWNVLLGQMAIIGPRPMVAGQRAGDRDYRDVVPYYDFRHLVRPGLSGWAQAKGLRGPTFDARAARMRIEHDCAYIQNFSLLLDMKIIFMTIPGVLYTNDAEYNAP